MKIPETLANVGAYYGNEENGQWQQPNGVMTDCGVGGGVVGAGDAGVQRPPLYPALVRRSPIPGYVMAGAYYPPAPYASPATPDDFADYMWIENEEEFDKQVIQQLEEEALMEQCIEAMLEDEQRERRRPNGHHQYPTTSNGAPSLSLAETVSRSRLNPLAAEFVRSRLNPLAAEFVPTAAVTRTVTEEKRDPPETPSAEPQQSEQEEQKPEEAEQLTDTHTDPQIGYVMAGAYYPPAPYAAPATPDDFADYMWIENEEEFDNQVIQQLEEEALMEQCIEAMLEDEQRERRRPNGHHQYPTTSNGASSLSLEETVARSRLNPLAAEFVPTAAVTRTVTEEKRDTPETPSAESQQSEQEEQKPEETEQLTDTHTEPQIEPTPPPTDPPEVSAADVQTDDKRKDKHSKRSEPKRAVRDNKAKGKAAQVKEATKVGKKEERREGRVGNSGDDSDGDVQPQPAPVEEQTGPKPINYAAAAKANKPKKPSTPPAAEKTSPVPTAGTKIDKKKVDKPVQRKNSAK